MPYNLRQQQSSAQSHPAPHFPLLHIFSNQTTMNINGFLPKSLTYNATTSPTLPFLLHLKSHAQATRIPLIAEDNQDYAYHHIPTVTLITRDQQMSWLRDWK